jgi:hypothetical protein
MVKEGVTMKSIDVKEKKAIARDLLGVAEDVVPKLSAYFKFYDDLMKSSSEQTIIGMDIANLHPPCDVLSVAASLRGDPQSTRDNLRNTSLKTTSEVSRLVKDRESAINIAVQLMLMIDCSASESHDKGYLIDGSKPHLWRNDESFATFVTRGFPTSDQTGVESLEVKKSLKAWRLKKRAYITFRATDNLMNHLLYDSRKQVVLLFHHTAFLKAQLELSKLEPLDASMLECLKM